MRPRFSSFYHCCYCHYSLNAPGRIKTATTITNKSSSFYCTFFRSLLFSSKSGEHNDEKRKGLGDLGDIDQNQVIGRLGVHPYGSREYCLVSSSLQKQKIQRRKIASLFANRNVIFGARIYDNSKKLSEVCLPLLDAALTDASADGEQPQALAALHGLSRWVVQQQQLCLETVQQNNDKTYILDSNKATNDPDTSSDNYSPQMSQVLLDLRQQKDLKSLRAIEVIATGTPPKGDSSGVGAFYDDAQKSWEALAKEYISLQFAEEVNLYQQRNGVLIDIECFVDTNPDYFKSAGGAMARLFFV